MHRPYLQGDGLDAAERPLHQRQGFVMATTLQINLAPTDLPHLIHILPHQIRQFGAQVDEILLTLDLHQSCGRFGTAWKERLPGVLDLTRTVGGPSEDTDS
jgi:hypothetical protein